MAKKISNEDLMKPSSEQKEVTCRYSQNGKPLLLTKKDIEGVKAFGKIVMNYFKIKRIERL